MSKKSVCLTALCLALAVTGPVVAEQPGKVLFEYWLNVTGTAVSNLTSAANYPVAADEYVFADSFKSAKSADNYGTRARAFVIPPETGSYTFWIASDDASQLWLSTDDNPANAKQIASVGTYTNADQWTKEAGQKSAAVTLTAGKRYYIEARHKEGTGGDNLSVGWAGPGIGEATVVIAGQYLVAPDPTFPAWNPNPANGATEINSPLFQWTAGKTAVMHEVYMGTNPKPGAAEFMGPWPTSMYFHIPGLTPGAKYYWRVDEVDVAGVKYPGPVWSFTVQPLEAHNPTPPDGMMGRALNVQLQWTAGQGAATHKVFVSADKALVTAGDAKALAGEATATNFSPADLKANTTYYWRVDEVDGAGKATSGPVWSFSTIDPAGGAVAEYWNDANLSFYGLNIMGAPAVVKTVPNVDLSWPSGTVKGTNSPDPNINTDYFAARFTAQLNVPVSGKYKLIESSDDGGRLYLNGNLIAGEWATGGESEKASADLDLVAGETYIVVLEYFEATSGAAARLRWSGPGISKQTIWQGALGIPKCAISGSPGNGAVEVPQDVALTWKPGPKAVVHTVYFGTDKAKVTAGDKSVAQAPVAEAKFVPAKALNWNTTYYWKVDEMAADGTTVPGQVWSFTTANFIVVGPGQKTLTYNNLVDPLVSQIAYNVPADLTAGGVTDLALRFQGQAEPQGSFDYNAGVYTIGGAGSDIWGTSDQFTYAYKALQGDGSMVVQVTSVGTGTNAWAKGGIMIRQSLNADSAYAIMALSADTGKADGGNGAAFQWRATTAASAVAGPNPASWIKPPYFVKLERKGNAFSGYMSPDGQTWTQLGTTQTITMTDPVFLGLAVSSHVNAATVRTMTFDSLSSTGNIVPDGPLSSWKIINSTVNGILPLYAAIEDKAGKVAMVIHPNPKAVSESNISTGTRVQYVYDLWRIPMSSFQGVDLKNAAKLYLGVGDGKSMGTGLMNFADVRIIKPVLALDPNAIDVTAKGDPLVGIPNDGVGADPIGWPAAEVPPNTIDDDVTTKFLHFKGDKEPTGFAVTPSIGYTVVKGLTFTTANDTPSRDPITWELYGAHKGVDGPWTLIAKGTIDDFSRTVDWPRRWKNVTPIGFVNGAAFACYKVMFPTLRYQTNGLANVPNSMQIAEVELLGVPGKQPIILDVVRTKGQSGTRTDGSPINGAYTGETPVMPMPAGGLKDGAFCYSDRNYPWSKTPAELVGAEYVLMYNSDKAAAEKDVTYTVTTSRTATIAITVDDRIPAEWNGGGAVTSPQAAADYVTAAFAKPGTFKDTGLDLFVHENATTDRPMSVYAAELPAGTYVFGPMWSNKNFYTIGAMEKK